MQSMRSLPLTMSLLALLLVLQPAASLDVQECEQLGFHRPGCDACRSLAEYVKDEGEELLCARVRVAAPTAARFPRWRALGALRRRHACRRRRCCQTTHPHKMHSACRRVQAVLRARRGRRGGRQVHKSCARGLHVQAQVSFLVVVLCGFFPRAPTRAVHAHNLNPLQPHLKQTKHCH